MGLAIRRSIVESHGDRLWATPNDTLEATFQITLPPEVTSSSPSGSLQALAGSVSENTGIGGETDRFLLATRLDS